MTLPGKLAPGLKGYPTPNDTPEEQGCFTFRFPNSSDYTGQLLGALQPLRDARNWYQWGEMTPDEAADAWSAIIDDAEAANYEAICEAGVPSPYWDDVTDLDDSLPPSEQTWYGIFDGTFQETIENFVIAGFIAYSGQIGAAITFLTLAPRFRLAWKTGDLGGIIRVIIDGADAGTVDTYSAVESVIERDYVGDPEEEEHNILMVLESVP